MEKNMSWASPRQDVSLALLVVHSVQRRVWEAIETGRSHLSRRRVLPVERLRANTYRDRS